MTKVEFPMTVQVKTESGIEFNVRPFLTASNLVAIMEQVKDLNIIERRFTADLLVARFCTDIAILDNDDVPYEVIDMYRANGVFDLMYDNIRAKDVALLEEMLTSLGDSSKVLEDIKTSVDVFLESILDYAKNLNIDNIKKEFDEEIGKLNNLNVKIGD